VRRAHVRRRARLLFVRLTRSRALRAATTAPQLTRRPRRRPFLSVTDVNGLLCRGQMFVLSTAAASTLLGAALASAPRRPTRLLDVGAGDGGVTARLAPLFGAVSATEVSVPMALRLRLRGFAATRTASIAAGALSARDGSFDVVALMNLLDRCDDPLGVLRDAARLAARGTGRVLVALVLPFNEFVEDGARRRAPRAPLPMDGARCGDGANFEASLAAFVARVLPRAGLALESLARAPYLCRGDARRPFYVLSDAVMVLRHVDAAEGGGGGAGGAGGSGAGGAGGEGGAGGCVDGAPVDGALRRAHAVTFRA
jgi:SAM-dependent methyltransferase